MKRLNLLLLSLALIFGFSTANADDDSTFFGSVVGAVVGGVIGNQFGGGSGKYVTTSVGAIVGSMVGRNIQQQFHESDEYQSDYAYPVPYNGYYERPSINKRVIYVAEDDYLIKQRMSDAAKRRNMIRNGEMDPLELPHDISEVQTSWDDPFN